MTTRLLFVHALSPLHAGTGQGIGVIDLPIAREKATGLPFLPGSSIKGTLRDSCAQPERDIVFGPETLDPNKFTGAAQFADARLLLLPVRSLTGTFAWVTSPYILRRLVRDAEGVDGSGVPKALPIPVEPPNSDGDEECLIATGSKIAYQQKVFLEDLDLIAKTDQTATDEWAKWLAQHVFPGADAAAQEWQQLLIARFCVVRDDVLTFLLNTALEVTARVKLLEKTKTVQDGGLWYEEALPVETVLAGLVLASRPIVKASNGALVDVFGVLTGLTNKTLQFGGKATVGRGLCRTLLG
ncbi:MAG: type III-B CRISPR module RAMP protein Cmr4 [Chloroflexota bacterium]|nr:type III-B CRISPR module RAMP protein Cmr4 [Chloroflexota bacterium]